MQNLRTRAAILHNIRQFFAARNVMEVETPLLYSVPASDPHLHSLQSDYHYPGGEYAKTLYLQTSPEFAMKRLLAAGSGSIYQISKAFRDQEQGDHHAGEFTLLEWYRVGWDEHQLMVEVDQLLQMVLHSQPATRYTYQALFEQYCQLDPHRASVEDLHRCAKQYHLHMTSLPEDKDTCLQLLMTHVIEPQLMRGQAVVMIHDFPATQAALARLKCDNAHLACRFEVYVHGIELANGFYELSNAKEQSARFAQDNIKRQQLGYPVVPIDDALLAALTQGLPDCAGVALGVDRLVMLALEEQTIGAVMSF
jgi:elongation factor P--(R)-beta-lysine ligase